MGCFFTKSCQDDQEEDLDTTPCLLASDNKANDVIRRLDCIISKTEEDLKLLSTNTLTFN